MRLSAYILDNRERILQQWEDHARSLASAKGMSTSALRDDLERMLRFVCEDLETAQTPAEAFDKSVGRGPATAGSESSAAHDHGVARAGEKFSIEEMVSEYRALRASITRMWLEEAQPTRDAVFQLVRFNEAIDQILAESVSRFRERVENDLRESEARQSFLLALSDRLRPLAAADDIRYEAACALGQHLQAPRVGYAEDDGDGEHVRVSRNFTRGVPGLEGRYRYADYGPDLLADLRSGKTVVRGDVANDAALTPREKEAHRVLQLGATLNVPLVKAERLVAIFFVHYQDAHAFSALEVRLVQEVAERVWSAVERARAEAALRESERRLAVVFDALPLGVALLDATGAVAFANGRMRDLLPSGRMPAVDPPRVARWCAYDPDGRQLAPEAFPGARALRGETVLPGIEFLYTDDDGTQRWTQVAALPIRDGDDRVTGAVAVATEIDAQKRAAEALREADRRKDEFLAVLAHELRNPLAPLATGLEVLKRVPADSAVARPQLDSMDRQLRHLVRLIDDLLDVGRIRRGVIALRRHAVRLADPVSEAADAARHEAEKHHQRLALRICAEALWVDADAARLTQVVANLLANAIKYTPDGGEIEVSLEREGDQAVLGVRDNGRGIAPGMQGRIFDMFSQLPGPEGQRDGLGIGLWLVQQLVQLHGGTVAVESAGEGQGTQFTVRLPLAARDVEPAAALAPDRPSVEASARVLVVDDNRDAAESLATMITLLGHETRTAFDGAEALPTLEVFKPQLVLLDVGMPGMDGYEVAQRMRASPAGERVRIVAVTGWGQEQDRRRAREAGFDDHLVKPVDIARIEAILASLPPAP